MRRRLSVGRAWALVALGLLVGCGGGQNESASAVLRSGVVVLPSDVEVLVVGSSSVTLSGNVPTLKQDDVIVSGAGEGLLRRVKSVSRTRQGTVVETGPATLEDVFEQANIAFRRDMGASDFASMTAYLPGVTIGTKRSATDLDRAPLEIELTLVDATLFEQGPAKVTLDGSVTVAITLDIAIELDWTGLKRFRFVPTVVGDGNVTLTSNAEFELFSGKVLLGVLVGNPMVVPAGPIPLVFVPELDLYARWDGSLEVGVEFTSAAEATLGAGVEYTRGAGWSPVVVLPPPELALIPAGNVYVHISFDLTPLRAELSLKLYGVVGPYVGVDFPRFELEYTRELNPAATRITAQAAFEGSAGAKVDVLGQTLVEVDYPGAVRQTFPFFQRVYPDSGGVIVIIG